MSNSEKSNSRYSIDLGLSHRAMLSEIAKRHKINQGEVIEVMLEQGVGNTAELAPAFDAKRAAKVAARAPKNTLLQQFRKLTPEQQRALMDEAIEKL